MWIIWCKTDIQAIVKSSHHKLVITPCTLVLSLGICLASFTLNLFINFGSFLVDNYHKNFHIQDHVICEKGQLHFYLSNLIEFYFCLFPLVGTFVIMLNISGESRHPCFLSNLYRMLFPSFILEYKVSFVIFMNALLSFRNFSSNSSCFL